MINMSLDSLLAKEGEFERKSVVHEEITPELISENLPQFRKLIAFWRVYPDMFIDYLCSLNPNNTFKFFYYQRVYLRSMLRYKHCYLVCPRGFSKSFLAVMALMIKCILYPGSSVFVVSGGKILCHPHQ